MRFPSKEEVERLRRSYPPGTRVELVETMIDPYAPVPAGTQGTVQEVEDNGDIEMVWDNHSTLKLLPDVDSFRIVQDAADA
ncbi:hypothetical protein FACS1894184_09440 [Clostridia bacterium]|nr:hypothetical protein FACS1894184_09440 [Clostridia bacterium]